MKGIQATGEASPLMKASNALKKHIFHFFSFCVWYFARMDTDPAIQNQCGSESTTLVYWWKWGSLSYTAFVYCQNWSYLLLMEIIFYFLNCRYHGNLLRCECSLRPIIHWVRAGDRKTRSAPPPFLVCWPATPPHYLVFLLFLICTLFCLHPLPIAFSSFLSLICTLFLSAGCTPSSLPSLPPYP